MDLLPNFRVTVELVRKTDQKTRIVCAVDGCNSGWRPPADGGQERQPPAPRHDRKKAPCTLLHLSRFGPGPVCCGGTGPTDCPRGLDVFRAQARIWRPVLRASFLPSALGAGAGKGCRTFVRRRRRAVLTPSRFRQRFRSATGASGRPGWEAPFEPEPDHAGV